jgi:hypothetical protein
MGVLHLHIAGGLVGRPEQDVDAAALAISDLPGERAVAL